MILILDYFCIILVKNNISGTCLKEELNLIIKTFIAGMYEENCYLVMDEDTKELAIIDPGGKPNKIEKEIKF